MMENAATPAHPGSRDYDKRNSQIIQCLAFSGFTQISQAAEPKWVLSVRDKYSRVGIQVFWVPAKNVSDIDCQGAIDKNGNFRKKLLLH
jgi:hypothetical protein